MAAKFLCCLPLRLGVFIISLFQFLLCGALAGISWWALWYNETNNIAGFTNSDKTRVIIVGSVYTFAAVVCLAGFLGAVFRKNGLVKLFLLLLSIVLLLQIGVSVYALYCYYHMRGRPVDGCVNGSQSSDKVEVAACNVLATFFRIPQGYIIASAIVPILVQTYACYVVGNYSKRIGRQNSADLKRSFTLNTPMYQPIKPLEDSIPLTHDRGYPYTDAPHSFGQTSDSGHLGSHDSAAKVV